MENKNNWIELKSDDDLKRLSGLYFVRNRVSGSISIAEIRGMSRFNRESSFKKYSHYQIIQLPEPPTI